MVLLSNLTCLRMSGIDAGDFLHNQVSADILSLASGQSTFACYCEPKGRVLALMQVNRRDDEYFVVLSASLAESISKRLRVYVMRSKVEIQELNERAVLGLWSTTDTYQQQAHDIVLSIPNSDDTLLVTSDVSSVKEDSALAAEWKLKELQAGIIWLDEPTSAQFLPQMLGYVELGAVNYRKGCYPGQEIVARTHYLGKVKRHPRLLYPVTLISPAAMDKIEIMSGDQTYSAVVTDWCRQAEDGGCVFVVTRMDPELVAEKVVFQGQEVELIAR